MINGAQPKQLFVCHLKGNRGTRSGFLIHSSFGSLSPLMEKAKRDSSRPRPEELTEKEARRVRPRVWKGQGKFLSTDEEQLIPPCYRFPSSFLRFPSPFCLQTSWCSWMRKENKKHAVALLYPLRTRAQKKEQSQQAEGTRWRGAHFSACDIFLGNDCLRSSLCVFLFSLSAASSGTDFFFFRFPFAFHLYWLTRDTI